MARSGKTSSTSPRLALDLLPAIIAAAISLFSAEWQSARAQSGTASGEEVPEFIRDLFDKTSRPKRLVELARAKEEGGGETGQTPPPSPTRRSASNPTIRHTGPFIRRPPVDGKDSSTPAATPKPTPSVEKKSVSPAAAPSVGPTPARAPSKSSEFDEPSPPRPSGRSRPEATGSISGLYNPFGQIGSAPSTKPLPQKDLTPPATPLPPSGYPMAQRSLASTSPIPEAARAAFEQGLAAFSDGRNAEAVAAFQQAKEAAPDHPAVLSNLGAAHFRAGNIDAATESLAAAVARDLNSAAAWQMLGIIRYQGGDAAGAHAALAQAAYLEPNDPRTNNYLGVVMTQLAFYDAAEEYLGRSTRADPDNAEAHFNLAVIYLRREPPTIELARRHYHKAVDLGAAPDPAVERLLGGGR